MARPIRIEYEGGFYHITSLGNARQDIFAETEDYRTFLVILADVVERYRWIVHAYCLMGNNTITSLWKLLRPLYPGACARSTACIPRSITDVTIV